MRFGRTAEATALISFAQTAALKSTNDPPSLSNWAGGYFLKAGDLKGEVLFMCALVARNMKRTASVPAGAQTI